MDGVSSSEAGKIAEQVSVEQRRDEAQGPSLRPSPSLRDFTSIQWALLVKMRGKEADRPRRNQQAHSANKLQPRAGGAQKWLLILPRGSLTTRSVPVPL